MKKKADEKEENKRPKKPGIAKAGEKPKPLSEDDEMTLEFISKKLKDSCQD